MRHGIGRARLCDLAGCPEKWPCPTHGTRRVGDYEHLGVHAGAFELAPITHGAEVVSETVPCGGCGWALCSCEPPPDGWERLKAGSGEFYEHVSGARVWRCGARVCATWGHYGPRGLDVHICHGPTAKATRAEAMRTVEALLAWALLA